MRPDGFVSYAGESNTKQVADAIAESTLSIDQADWNSVEPKDLIQLIEARAMLQSIALKYRKNANAMEGDAAEQPVTPAEVIADVLQLIWGQNPQAPVEELSSTYLLEKLATSWGEDVVADAVDRTGWDVDVPDAEVSDVRE